LAKKDEIHGGNCEECEEGEIASKIVICSEVIVAQRFDE
jgi:hypothetical protein